MKVNELSQKSGINAETIHYYEKIGLLPPPKRAANGYRFYGEDMLDLLAFIKNCRSLGFSIEDIKALNGLKNAPAEHRRADAIVQAQLQNAQDKIARLQEIAAFLQTLSDGGEHDAEDCKAISGLEG